MIRLSTPAGKALAELVVELADADRLARGRTYQRKGYAGLVDIAPGAAQVTVHGSRDEPYLVTVAVREAGENVRTAAGEDVAAAAPAAGDVGFSCDCPDWGDPCKHGVAALLQLAREVDDDAGLLLRWRGIDDVIPPAPPGTGPLVDDDAGGPVSFDSLAALDALAETRTRAGATSAYDPDDEPPLDSFGRPHGGRRRNGGGRAVRRWGDHTGDDFDGDAGDGGDGFSRAFGVDPAPEIPGPGEAARAIRRRFGAERPVGATAEERLADLRRRLGADLVDPADVAAAEVRARAGADAVAADGPLARFFGHDVAEVIDPPPPLDVVPLDAYHHVRIMVETTDVAPVVADALETITDHWLTR